MPNIGNGDGFPKAVLKAAKLFLEQLDPDTDWSYPQLDKCIIRRNVRLAFWLYRDEWESGHDISKWEWPFTTLSEGQSFDGSEPWTVLLRTAVTDVRKTKSPAINALQLCYDLLLNSDVQYFIGHKMGEFSMLHTALNAARPILRQTGGSY